MAVTIILILLTLIYTFYLGFNDGANAVASSITTRAMKPRTAIYIAAVTKFVTPLFLFFKINDLAVADTIKRDLLKAGILENSSTKVGVVFLMAGLLATLIWSFYTYYKELPNSASHTLIGGLVGSAVAAFGFNSVVWGKTVIFKVLIMAIVAPIIGLVIGFLFMRLFRKLAKTAPSAINGVLKHLQKVNVIVLASSFSLNNAQKSYGVLLLIVMVSGKSLFASSVQNYILLGICGLMLTIGMLFGGYRIINTVGNKIFKLKPFHSVVAQISTGGIVFASSAFGIPVSTGQIVASSIMGVGAAERLSGVQWMTAKKIFISWFITFPISAILGGGLYYLIGLIGGVL